jgi:signal transduction histidine kinase
MGSDRSVRPFVLIAAFGLVAALVVAVAGRLVERARLGADDLAAYLQVEQEVRRDFEQMSETLAQKAKAEAAAAQPILRQRADDRDLRPLFDQAATLIAGDGTAFALTVYGLDGTPLAWAGRPSELSADRLSGRPALFIAPGPLGFRLVHVEPVVGGGPGTARLGVVAAERVFPEPGQPVGNTAGDRFSLDTSLVPVSLRALHEGAGEATRPGSFAVWTASGEPLVEATVDPATLRDARREARQQVASAALLVLALTTLLLVGPVLDRRALARTGRAYLGATCAAAALLMGSRALFAWAVPPGRPRLVSPDVYHWAQLGAYGRHPVDFFLTALFLLALVALVAGALERWRQVLRGRRHPAMSGRLPALGFALSVVCGGGLAAGALIGYEGFLAETFRRSAVDILDFAPNPWQPERMAMALGLVCHHAACVWALVLILRLLLARWRSPRRDVSANAALLTLLIAPVAGVWAWTWRGALASLPRVEALLVVGALVTAVALAPRGLIRLRRASQGYRLIVAFFALLAPAVVMYPSLVFFQEGARRRAIETNYGLEVLNQRDNLRMRLRAAQAEIDGREAALEAAAQMPAAPPGTSVRTDAAFQMWQGTALERYRVSSAIELYNSSEMLVSRFALNLPEDTSGQTWREESCAWSTFSEISPFGSHLRQLLHAGRNVCGAGRVLGTIVIRVILDNSTLSFISSQNPYQELSRGPSGPTREDVRSRDVEFVMYGWSRAPLYVSGNGAWPLDDQLFARISAGRQPFWARLSLAGADYNVYIENDRSGIHALGYPLVPAVGHFTNLAELSVLVALAYVGILIASGLVRLVGIRRVRSGRALLREVRESFYRKLFLAFVAVSVVPVVTLALVTRVYIGERLRQDVESAAHKTTVIARQIIEDYRVQPSATLNDDAMVGLSRMIGQDVNLFSGPRLQATSERDLFASGLLPARTPADVYRGVVLDRMPTVITEEQAAGLRYMVAAAPLRVSDRDTILTVPLTLRQREIEREIDELNRRIVLAAMLFILFGAAIGYPMAERIADPVSRLTRATRRIARGDFDARVAATSSDELRRLVDAFNRMSEELLRQRQQLERTHRLEAWAEMARQVAHDIKNPLTPIQLSAEHLRRVHADRGRPLAPVLEGCVDSILSQVRLLRQIASEFSSFASSPTPRLAATDLAELVDEVVQPYEVGAADRWTFPRRFAPDLPRLRIDRTLIGRALTNVIDNALHAMPGGGTVTIGARLDPLDRVELTLADTGMGMDEEALSRLFEPYFSTKAVGTGLGLSIARRNVELNNGTITVASEKGRGTQVTLILPAERE